MLPFSSADRTLCLTHHERDGEGWKAVSEVRESRSFCPVVPAVAAAFGKCVCAGVCVLVSLQASSHTDFGLISDSITF